MVKFFHVALAVVLAFGVGTIVLPGCSGGDSNGISSNAVRRYAGSYSGVFAGSVVGAPVPISGNFTALVDNEGNVT